MMVGNALQSLSLFLPRGKVGIFVGHSRRRREIEIDTAANLSLRSRARLKEEKLSREDCSCYIFSLRLTRRNDHPLLANSFQDLILEMDAVDVNAEIHQFLGLKRTSKIGSPRVLALLSSLLERSVHRNELLLKTAEFEDTITVFHGSRAPALSIRQYIHRIFKYAGCSPSCYVIAVIYIDRMIRFAQLQLTSRNVHRLLITGIMLAAKFIDDRVFNNAYYAKVGGVSTGELNRLEMKFLCSIDFRLQVSVETFDRYCRQLEKEGHQIERPIKSCGIKEIWANKEDSELYFPPLLHDWIHLNSSEKQDVRMN